MKDDVVPPLGLARATLTASAGLWTTTVPLTVSQLHGLDKEVATLARQRGLATAHSRALLGTAGVQLAGKASQLATTVYLQRALANGPMAASPVLATATSYCLVAIVAQPILYNNITKVTYAPLLRSRGRTPPPFSLTTLWDSVRVGFKPSFAREFLATGLALGVAPYVRRAMYGYAGVDPATAHWAWVPASGAVAGSMCGCLTQFLHNIALEESARDKLGLPGSTRHAATALWARLGMRMAMQGVTRRAPLIATATVLGSVTYSKYLVSAVKD